MIVLIHHPLCRYLTSTLRFHNAFLPFKWHDSWSCHPLSVNGCFNGQTSPNVSNGWCIFPTHHIGPISTTDVSTPRSSSIWLSHYQQSCLLPTAHLRYSVLAQSRLRDFCSTANMLYVPTLSLSCAVADALHSRVVDSLTSSIDKISKSRSVHNPHRSTRVSNTVRQRTFISGV